MAKNVQWAKEPHPVKSPTWRDPAIDGQPLAWRFSTCDKGGPFSWLSLTDPEFRTVVHKLHEFETKTLDELSAQGSHPVDKDRLEKPARKRLSDIKQDDIDALMSFRITGKQRVWCIRDRNIMRVLWWDPKHEVCEWQTNPTDRAKKNKRR